jgi:hypothetical protein
VRNTAQVLLLVDAANVVGSRPDGWWRDRAAAAARLVRSLAALPGTELDGVVVDRVTAVLEGRARAGAAPRAGPVSVVHAPGAGDDTLAALCGGGVVLVTADRALAARARSAGAEVLSPGRLLAALERELPGSMGAAHRPGGGAGPVAGGAD